MPTVGVAASPLMFEVGNARALPDPPMRDPSVRRMLRWRCRCTRSGSDMRSPSRGVTRFESAGASGVPTACVPPASMVSGRVVDPVSRLMAEIA